MRLGEASVARRRAPSGCVNPGISRIACLDVVLCLRRVRPSVESRCCSVLWIWLYAHVHVLLDWALRPAPARHSAARHQAPHGTNTSTVTNSPRGSRGGLTRTRRGPPLQLVASILGGDRTPQAHGPEALGVAPDPRRSARVLSPCVAFVIFVHARTPSCAPSSLIAGVWV